VHPLHKITLAPLALVLLTFSDQPANRKPHSPRTPRPGADGVIDRLAEAEGEELFRRQMREMRAEVPAMKEEDERQIQAESTD